MKRDASEIGRLWEEGRFQAEMLEDDFHQFESIDKSQENLVELKLIVEEIERLRNRLLNGKITCKLYPQD